MDQGVERCESSGTENSMSESSIQTSSGGVETTHMHGKQKKLADLEKLNQEIRYLEEELEELDKIETAENTCKRMILVIEHRPDPLLPITKGPENPSWDRWFEGPEETDGCRCRIS